MNKNHLKKVRDDGFDKFYTKKEISKHCLDIVGSLYKWEEWDMVIEPSAGNGSFLLQIPTKKKIGMDILPEHRDIIKRDFFTYKSQDNHKKILVVGNPPFGKVSSIAIKFFNHASKIANTIAFILPRTFRRISIQNKLNRNFHLLYDKEIPVNPCSFEPNMSVKCCFQVWQKKDIKREIVKLVTSHNDWVFLKFGNKDNNNQPSPPIGADFVIKAYGSNCGEIVRENLEKLRPKSWHWIKSNIDKETLIKRFKSLDYTLSLDTARQNSIGKGELVKIYTESYN